MTIKAIRAGSKPRKRQLAATYTQAQVDSLIKGHMQSYRQVAHELRQLVLELSATRRAGRFADNVEVKREVLLKVLTKSADLADL